MQPIGTVKLLRQHGAALVCVRYRLYDSGRRRCTTIELMVGQAPATRRPDPSVAVRVRYEETELRTKVVACRRPVEPRREAVAHVPPRCPCLGPDGQDRRKLTRSG